MEINTMIKNYIKEIKKYPMSLIYDYNLYKEGIKLLEWISDIRPTNINNFSTYIFNNIAGIRFLDKIKPLPDEIKNYINKALSNK